MGCAYIFQYHARGEDTCDGEYPAAKSINNSFEFDDAATWDVVHREFLSFLSSVYGYDISKHVDVKTFSQRMAAFNNED